MTISLTTQVNDWQAEEAEFARARASRLATAEPIPRPQYATPQPLVKPPLLPPPDNRSHLQAATDEYVNRKQAAQRVAAAEKSQQRATRPRQFGLGALHQHSPPKFQLPTTSDRAIAAKLGLAYADGRIFRAPSRSIYTRAGEPVYNVAGTASPPRQRPASARCRSPPRSEVRRT